MFLSDNKYFAIQSSYATSFALKFFVSRDADFLAPSRKQNLSDPSNSHLLFLLLYKDNQVLLTLALFLSNLAFIGTLEPLV